MRKVFLLSAILVFVFASLSLAWMNLTQVGGSGVVGEETSCTVGSGSQWVCDTDNDWHSLTAHACECLNYQYVSNSTAIAICRIDVKLDEDGAGTTSISVEIYDDTSKTTLLGSADSAVTVDGATAAWYQFDFSTPVEPGANDFVIFFHPDNSDADMITSNTDTFFGESTINFVNDGSGSADDANIKIYYNQ